MDVCTSGAVDKMPLTLIGGHRNRLFQQMQSPDATEPPRKRRRIDQQQIFESHADGVATDDEDDDLMEDTADLGEDDDDLDEVREHIEPEDETKE